MSRGECHIFKISLLNRVQYHQICLGFALGVCALMVFCFKLKDAFAAFRSADGNQLAARIKRCKMWLGYANAYYASVDDEQVHCTGDCKRLACMVNVCHVLDWAQGCFQAEMQLPLRRILPERKKGNQI